MRGKSLTVEQNAALRALAVEVINRDFKGKTSRAAVARPHPVAHPTLFDFVNGNRGAGIRVIEWLSARTGKSMDTLLGLGEAGVRVEYDRSPGIAPTSIGNHPTWKKDRADFLERYAASINPAIVDGPDGVEGMSLSIGLPEHLTPELIKTFYDAIAAARAQRDAEARARKPVKIVRDT